MQCTLCLKHQLMMLLSCSLLYNTPSGLLGLVKSTADTRRPWLLAVAAAASSPAVKSCCDKSRYAGTGCTWLRTCRTDEWNKKKLITRG